MKTLYTTHVQVTGGRDGRAASSDGRLDLKLASPKTLGGLGDGTNPEQLFAAGYAACFEGAIRFLARMQKLPLTGARVAADVALLDGGDEGFKLTVALGVTLAGLSVEAAETLVARADEVCPYSNAIRGNVPVVITVETASVV